MPSNNSKKRGRSRPCYILPCPDFEASGHHSPIQVLSLQFLYRLKRETLCAAVQDLFEPVYELFYKGYGFCNYGVRPHELNTIST